MPARLNSHKYTRGKRFFFEPLVSKGRMGKSLKGDVLEMGQRDEEKDYV